MMERKVSGMKDLNGDMLFEKLKTMPRQKLSIEAKNRIIKNIRSLGIELQLNKAKTRKKWAICTAAAVFIAAAVFSAGTFTEYGRQLSSNLLADVKSLYNGNGKNQKLVQNTNEVVTPMPSLSPTPAADNSETETAEEDLLNANSYLQYIKMIDKNSGWAVSRVSVFHTNDGGTTWKDVTPKNKKGDFAGQYFLDKNNGWAAFSESGKYTCTIFRTSDGGVTWKQASGSIKSYCLTFYFYDRTHGWAIAHKDIGMHYEEADILKTSDGGLSWSIISSSKEGDKAGALPFYGAKTSLTFNSTESGWVSEDIPTPGLPYFYHSSDGGHTWKAVNLTVPVKLKNSDAYAGTPVFFSKIDGILPVRFSGDEESYVIYMTHDGGNTWSANTPVTLSQGKQLYWDFLSTKYGFMFNGMNIYMTGDSGKNWSNVTCTTPLEDISQISFIDKNTIITINQGILYETDNAGRTWYKKPTNLPYLPYTRMSSNTKNEDAAKILFEKYLDHYKDEGILQAQKITGYKIDEISVANSSETGFTFNAKFTVQCSKDSNYWTGGTEPDNDGWTGQKHLTVTVSRIDNSFTVTNID